MAFGRLVNKFRILGRKVEGSMDRVSKILTACARLHNFVIQQDGPFGSSSGGVSLADEYKENGILPAPAAPFPDMSFMPSIPNDEFVSIPGISSTRDSIVRMIDTCMYHRPLHNIIRQSEDVLMYHSPSGQSVHRDYISPL